MCSPLKFVCPLRLCRFFIIYFSDYVWRLLLISHSSGVRWSVCRYLCDERKPVEKWVIVFAWRTNRQHDACLSNSNNNLKTRYGPTKKMKKPSMKMHENGTKKEQQQWEMEKRSAFTLCVSPSRCINSSLCDFSFIQRHPSSSSHCCCCCCVMMMPAKSREELKAKQNTWKWAEKRKKQKNINLIVLIVVADHLLAA